MSRNQKLQYPIYDLFADEHPGRTGKETVRRILQKMAGRPISLVIMNAWPSHIAGGAFPARYAAMMKIACLKRGIAWRPSHFELKPEFRHRIRR